MRNRPTGIAIIAATLGIAAQPAARRVAVATAAIDGAGAVRRLP
jgi:hypothetical protein